METLMVPLPKSATSGPAISVNSCNNEKKSYEKYLAHPINNYMLMQRMVINIQTGYAFFVIK